MSGRARLQALRLHGFKSFAERTTVEFVPGINAVVGPNGSGKSNLADALRWALGEQGRALRSRRAEDVVFAGSERRPALGMADVTLVLDNGDGLVPVDFALLEVGRRLFRSGENDYLVNRQRVRLRDLVELLDAARLADNAFLFIGQGMVDQALALRPEERRPLFEEVAGVRRHERRRRRAEEQLGEAEANLARVEDILAELRPQVRRLAAQAEQQSSRERAGAELAEALVAAFAARWHDASGEADRAAEALGGAGRAAASALEELRAAEGAAAAAAAELGARGELEAERWAAYEAARSALAAIDLERAAAGAELAAIGRDRDRLAADRRAAAAELAARRLELALPTPAPDAAAERELAEAEAALAEARAEAGALRAATLRRSERSAALARAAAARSGEIAALRRRLGGAEAALAEAVALATASREAHGAAAAALEEASRAASAARRDEEEAAARREAARLADTAAAAERAEAADAEARARAAAAAVHGRLEALRARAATDDRRRLAATSRRAGGRALASGLDVEPAMRRLVAMALGDLGAGFVVRQDSLAALAGQRGSVFLEDAAGPGAHAAGAGELAAARSAAKRAGGGLLGDALRADPTGAARRLLQRWAWAPTTSDAAELAAALPVGWRVATRDDSIVGVEGTVWLGIAEGALERRHEIEALESTRAAAERAAAAARDRLAGAEAAAAAARAGVEEARLAEGRAGTRRRAAEEDERRAARAAEQATREEAWATARAANLRAESEGLAGRLAALEAEAGGAGTAGSPDDEERGTSAADAAGGALAAWEARAAALAARLADLAAAGAARERERRAADDRRARAEAAAGAAAERMRRSEAEAAEIERRAASLEEAGQARDAAHAAASARENAARADLESARAADAAGRERLRTAEAAVGVARERLSRADAVHRAAEVRDLEARLALEALREQALVEFAALGSRGIRALDPASGAADDEDSLPAAIATAAAAWAARPAPAEAPSTGRLAALRRRFHDLGAGNPFAVEEHTQLRERVDALASQRDDLVAAIERTRGLIGELDGLIARQFRSTFAALEDAFDRQFRLLFGGGFARLSLTDPADLAQTGIEIVARPPGKKAQALAMLSGGERALTAVALLFSMLEVRPVPFCVLDEVDAALDEANVGRFVEALRALARTTQFVVITHNRGTIEAADALFGVTVGEDAVSRVVSLRLEEAQSIAAEAREIGATAVAAGGG